LEGGVVLADAAEHARDDGEAGVAEDGPGVAPGGGVIGQRVERELDLADAAPLDALGELARVVGPERPAADAEAVGDVGHRVAAPARGEVHSGSKAEA